ncbi:MAG: AzlD domain-containing protein [Actinomycetota bacterium]|nr:AzlD domain-containing protein [Actinomycetota bacterium]
MTTAVWAAVLIGLGTVALRAGVLVFAEHLADLPPRVHEVLRMIPPAALAALVTPALLRPEGQLAVFGPEALAGLAALVIAWRTRSLLATILVGLVAVIALQLLLG